ncbi:MAG: Bax inhibitor-1/YccA family protein, partial [Bdellovibrionales bacterium]|nr:Bax inhibitor-1/YccA family protein [Bdellovibrionales bacterium]
MAIMGTQKDSTAVQVICTFFGFSLALIVFYRLKWLRITAPFLNGMVRVLASLLSAVSLDFFTNLFNPGYRSIVWSYHPFSLAISALLVIAGGVLFVFSLDEIEGYLKKPKSDELEWYAAYCLLLSLIWIFIAIFFLAARIRSKR